MTNAKKGRRNGFELPWSGQQYVAYFFVLFFTIMYFGGIAPVFRSDVCILAELLPGIFFAILIITMAVSTYIDPADPNLFKRSPDVEMPVAIDRSQRPRVIQDGHCYFCQTEVGARSKHCRVCNKCIGEFDHHCAFLNNCVGSANYNWFLACVISGTIGALLVIAFSLTAFIGHYENRALFERHYDHAGRLEYHMFGSPVADESFLAVVGIVCTCACIAFCLIGHLTVFHFLLIFHGYSTYDFIKLKMEDDSASLCNFKTNKIRPESVGDDSDKKDDWGAGVAAHTVVQVAWDEDDPGEEARDQQHRSTPAHGETEHLSALPPHRDSNDPQRTSHDDRHSIDANEASHPPLLPPPPAILGKPQMPFNDMESLHTRAVLASKFPDVERVSELVSQPVGGFLLPGHTASSSDVDSALLSDTQSSNPHHGKDHSLLIAPPRLPPIDRAGSARSRLIEPISHGEGGEGGSSIKEVIRRSKLSVDLAHAQGVDIATSNV